MKKKKVISSDNDEDDDNEDEESDNNFGNDSFSNAENEKPPTGTAAAASKGKKKTVEEIYQKKTQLEHIILRPDTYIGSVETIKNMMWVWNAAGEQEMEYREISYVPGFYKIFDEILVNAADNKIRDPKMDTLKVVIDKEAGSISVMNNGRGIPVKVHKGEGVYVPELIFGHLLTSSNYDDGEKKVTGGRNGYGAKLCNIFSREFIVETADKESGKKFKQVFKKNMSIKGEPIITSNSRNEEYTRITFKPDFEKFGMASIDEDTEALFTKRVYDLAGCINGVKVYLNNERLPIRSFKQYVELYLGKKLDPQTNKPPVVIHEVFNDRWEVAFAVSEGQFQQVSFVNSICTSKGGTHVNYISDQIAAKLVDVVSKKNKGAPVKPFQIRNHMWVFVNSLIENPAFDSQTKENMTLKQSSFGSKCTVTDEFMTKVKKTGIVEHVLQWAQFKQSQQLKKTDGSKKSRISGITKLDDANNAGTRNASQCFLILTEGDSAKTLALSGLGVVGRDNYGVFPLRGKLLNVREASHKQIMENQEINQVKQILGLQHGKKYTDTSSLRYGHIMIMTDQDHDGSHIKGLIINFLDHFWPELLRVAGFLCEFITPIVKVTKGKNSIPFYTIPEYEAWKLENNEGKGWTIKYYKGLGTSTKEDARKYFSNIDEHRKFFFAAEEEERQLIDMAFSKKKADHRKEWLRQYEPGTFMDHSDDQLSLKNFINKELILFSMADNCRSLPCFVDGLKPGLRKIMFACFKRNLVKEEIKVAQLSGYIAEHSAYHHGEQSLQSSIVGLAQNFVGSNNINLLEPLGQYGSRLQGGKDAASPRYIFTRLAPLARVIFPKADDALLNYLNDDGQSIEPEWYMPILPLLLVNGGEGIGTGWSSSIPNYNPKDIVDNINNLMDGEPFKPMDPWYLGFNGSIESQGVDKYVVAGKIEKTGPTTVEITELPVRSWTQSYKEFLESMLHGNEKTDAFIKDYKEYHTDTKVHFVVSLTEQNMRKAEEEGLEKKFKVVSSISLSNMVCLDEKGRIKKYNGAEEILREFYQLRLKFYHKRKEHLVETLSNELEMLDCKARFVSEIVKGTLVVQNRKKADIVGTLRSRGYRSFGGEESDAGFNYLLSLPILSLSMEKIEILLAERDGKKQELNELLSKTSKDLWKCDLDLFVAEWESFVKELESSDEPLPAKARGGSKKKKPITFKPKKKKQLNSDGEPSMSSESDDFEDDDDDEDFGFKPKGKKLTTVPKPVSIPAVIKSISSYPVATAKKSSKRKEESGSEDLIPSSPVKKVKAPAAKSKSVASKQKPVAFSKRIIASSDDSETEIVVQINDSSPRDRSNRGTKKPTAYVEISDDDEQTSGESAVSDHFSSEEEEESDFEY